MKTNRKYTKLCALLLMLVMLMTACGEKNTDNNSAPTTTNGGSDVTTTENTNKTESNEGSKVWGVYCENSIINADGDGIAYAIQFPSLVPVFSGRVNVAYQNDPTLVMIGSGGTKYTADSLENVFESYDELMVFGMDKYRNYKYDDFAFSIDSKEAEKINDISMYKYTGKHTFTFESEAYEIPYVAYTADLAQGNGAYMFFMVLDESMLHPEMEAVEDGVIEDYAYRMATSLHTR